MSLADMPVNTPVVITGAVTTGRKTLPSSNVNCTACTVCPAYVPAAAA